MRSVRTLSLVLLALGAPPAASLTRPEAKAGPYWVVVDRVLQNRRVAASYGQAARPALEANASVQVQVAVYTQDPKAAAGLSNFQINGVFVESGGHLIDLPNYGGSLDSTNDTAILRAYIHFPTTPSDLRELRVIEGQITAWAESAKATLAIPLPGRKPPFTVEQDGVKATVRVLAGEGGSVQLILSLETAEGSALQSPSGDLNYGISLRDAQEHAATVLSATQTQPQPHQLEYRLGFATQTEPAKLEIRYIHQRGPRRTYPFKIERVPLPSAVRK